MARIPSPLDVEQLLRTLVRHDVRFVVIGGVAGVLHGSATLTKDLDVVYDRDRQNIRRLGTALAELEARRRDLPRGVSAAVDAQAVLNGMNLLLVTRHGDLDLLGETPSDRLTYPELAPGSVRFEISDDLTIAVASLDDLIRMKRATGRPEDRIEVERLSALRDEHELREPAGIYKRPRRGRVPKAARSPSTRRGRAAPAPRGRARTRRR